MTKKNVLELSVPTPVLKKAIKVDFKELVKILGKAGAHIALTKWDSLAEDLGEALGALGLQDSVEALAGLLVKRSFCRAVSRLHDEMDDLVRPEVEVSDFGNLILCSFAGRIDPV